MHDAVGKIKISIMQNKHHWKNHPEIKHTVLVYITVNGGIGFNV